MADEVLIDKLLERVSLVVSRELPRGFAFVLLIDNGKEAAMLSPHGAEMALAILKRALISMNPDDPPDLTTLVPRGRFHD